MELTLNAHDLGELSQEVSKKGTIKSKFPLYALRLHHFQRHVQAAIKSVGNATYWAPHGHFVRIYKD